MSDTSGSKRRGYGYGSRCIQVLVVGLAVAWTLKTPGGEAEPVARPVHDLPRTAQVFSAEESEYLASLYWSHHASFRQTYYNLLQLRRNSPRDERLANIFDKVVRVANSLPGGGGDYMVTNDFYSYRDPETVQFAAHGAFHMDCDFWKTESSDGFNLWVLLDHNELNESFDVVQMDNNRAIYGSYNGAEPMILLPEVASDPNTSFRRIQIPPVKFRRGHREALNWRVSFQVLLRQTMIAFFTQVVNVQFPFDVPPPNRTQRELGIGEALVVREQEWHRSDLHRVLRPGQFRLAVGFKMQRRGAVMRAFDLQCVAQKDRFNLKALWEHEGEPMRAAYAQLPDDRDPLISLDAVGRTIALLTANAGVLAASAAGIVMLTWRKSRGAAIAAAASGLGALALSVALQWRWFFGVPAAAAFGFQAHQRSSIIA